MTKKTFNVKDTTIGSKVYVVHKKYAFEKIPGGKISQGRIVSYVNRAGVIEPEFRIVGQPSSVPTLNVGNYVLFTDIKKAFEAIKS